VITLAADDPAIRLLLDLDGQRIAVDEARSFWMKFDVRRVPIDDRHPHGLRYSMTLHDRSGKRLVGFDNAHEVRSSTGPGARRSRDHRHRAARIEVYDFSDAATLLEDFYAEVERVIREKGIRR
jgi:hypothetical protein